jgi:hypothetical protein
MSPTTRFWRSSGISRMPNARLAIRRSRDTTPREKYAGTASSGVARLRVAAELKMSGSDRAGQSWGGSFDCTQSLPDK